MGDEAQSQLSELSTEVFEKFLAELEQAGIPEEVRARLRDALLVRPRLSDVALRAAVFGEEAPQ